MDLFTKPIGSPTASLADASAPAGSNFAKSACCPYCGGTKSVKIADAGGSREVACPLCSGGPRPLVTK